MGLLLANVFVLLASIPVAIIALIILIVMVAYDVVTSLGKALWRMFKE